MPGHDVITIVITGPTTRFSLPGSEEVPAFIPAPLKNFQRIYCPFGPPRLLGERLMRPKKPAKTRQPISFAAGVGRALRRAAKDARKTARMCGTPLYIWENMLALRSVPGVVVVRQNCHRSLKNPPALLGNHT